MYFLLGILLLPFLIGYFKEFRFVVFFFFQHLELYRYFFYGFGGYIVLHILFLRRFIGVWQTLTHEITHGIFALLFFKKVIKISASEKVEDNGGFTELVPNGNLIIRLAPYFFPIYFFIFFVVGIFFNILNSPLFQIFLGIVASYQFWTIFKQMRPFQPDLKRQGLVFSYTFILLMNIIVISCVLIILRSNWHECGQFFRNGFSHTLKIYQQGYLLLRALIPNG